MSLVSLRQFMMPMDTTGSEKSQERRSCRLRDVGRSRVFEGISRIMVVFYSFWISVDLDGNKAEVFLESQLIFQVMAHIFCSFFVGEFIFRLLAFDSKCMAFVDLHMVFDGMLVLMNIFEAWLPVAFFLVTGRTGLGTGVGVRAVGILRLVRILRAMRALRVVKVLGALPELLIFMKGIAMALRAILVVMTLLSFVVYMGAVVMRVLAEGTVVGNGRFDSVLTAMGTLLLDCTLSGSRGIEVMRDANKESFFLAVAIFLFVLIANLTMMGLLTGVLVQSVRAHADHEQEELLVRRINQVVDDIWEHISHFDQDRDGRINETEMLSLIQNKQFARALQSMDVDLQGFLDLSGYMYKQMGCQKAGGLKKRDFKKMIFDLRGKSQAKVKHHIETRHLICSFVQELIETLPRSLSHVPRRDLVSGAIASVALKSVVMNSRHPGCHHPGACEEGSKTKLPDDAPPWVPRSRAYGSDSLGLLSTGGESGVTPSVKL